MSDWWHPRIENTRFERTGKYDYTVPKGLADEVMRNVASSRKKLVILPHSGPVRVLGTVSLIDSHRSKLPGAHLNGLVSQEKAG